MILHIPHASRVIPPEEREVFACGDSALEQELLRSTDAHTDRLFDVPEAERVVFPVSRLVVDPERFLDDAREPMAAHGRGVVYTHTVGGHPLVKLYDEGVGFTWEQVRTRRIQSYYTPHHQRLERAVSDSLALRGCALIIDCHSFPAKPWAVERDPEALRPEFCIGTDPFHTPSDLTSLAMSFLSSRGISVAINRPYAGTIVPMDYYQKDPRVISIMIEVRRDLYMDETTGAPNSTFNACRVTLRRLLEDLLGWERLRGRGVPSPAS